MIKVGEKIGSLKRINRTQLKNLLKKEEKIFYVIPKNLYHKNLTEEEIKQNAEMPVFKEWKSDLDYSMRVLYEIFSEGYDNKELIFIEG